MVNVADRVIDEESYVRNASRSTVCSQDVKMEKIFPETRGKKTEQEDLKDRQIGWGRYIYLGATSICLQQKCAN